jgi:hypothetical protein
VQKFDERERAAVPLRLGPANSLVAVEAGPVRSLGRADPGPVLKVEEGTSVEVTLDGARPPLTLFRSPAAKPGTYLYRAEGSLVAPGDSDAVGPSNRFHGMLVVTPNRSDYWPAADSERFLVLDDLVLGPLVDEAAKLGPLGREGKTGSATNHKLLVNGSSAWETKLSVGEVVRVHLANAAPSRPLRLHLPGANLKLVGSGVGRVELGEFVDEVYLVPGDRAVVDVRFEHHGRYRLENRLPGRSLSAAAFEVGPSVGSTDAWAAYHQLRIDPDLRRLRRTLDDLLARPPDVALSIDLATKSQPAVLVAADGATKLRLTNKACPRRPLQALVHLESERFIVLSRDGAPSRSLAWSDTLLLRAGEVVDVLLEPSEPRTLTFHYRDVDLSGGGIVARLQLGGDHGRTRDDR